MEANTDIKVSVIVPIYNAAAYLSVALDGILSQTLTDIEVICVDDASTDESAELVTQRQSEDGRIKLIRSDVNVGPGAARNLGLAEAKGKYVAFLDADDIYEMEMLESLYLLAEKDDLDIAVGGYDLYRNRTSCFGPAKVAEEDAQFVPGTVTSKSSKPHVVFQMTDGYVWNKLFSRRFLTEKELSFDAGIRLYEDVLFVYCALSLCERMNRTTDVLMHHRVYSEQTRNRSFRKYYAAVPDVYLSLKRFLVHRGLYLPLCETYSRLSATRCYVAYNRLWLDAKFPYWNRLHNLRETLGWDESTPNYIRDEDVKNFVTCVVAFTYAQHIRREARGIKLRFPNFVRRVRAERKRRARAADIKDFFELQRAPKEEDPKI